MTTPQWNNASQAVAEARSILVVTHISPDGDAIGSLLGLTNALRDMGKHVVAAVDGGVPGYLDFCKGSDTVAAVLNIGKWDLMISVDASDEERTGKCGEYGRANSQKVINLDHHATNTFFGDVHLVEPNAVSATEVIVHWLNHMNFDFNTDVAIPLLTGLVTDTLGFRTSNVTPETFTIAQQLMGAGASLPLIMARTLESRSYKSLRLWQEAFPSIALENSVISAYVSQQNVTTAGLSETTDARLVSLLNTVAEAMIAVVFKETENGDIELSLRSKPGFDVSEVAFALGGGGHKQASGATIAGPLDAAKQRVLPMLYEAVGKGALTFA